MLVSGQSVRSVAEPENLWPQAMLWQGLLSSGQVGKVVGRRCACAARLPKLCKGLLGSGQAGQVVAGLACKPDYSLASLARA